MLVSTDWAICSDFNFPERELFCIALFFCVLDSAIVFSRIAAFTGYCQLGGVPGFDICPLIIGDNRHSMSKVPKAIRLFINLRHWLIWQM